MIIYAVYAYDFEASWIKKAFVSKEKAEAYAEELIRCSISLRELQKEYERRWDDIWHRVYDENGWNEPFFEKLDAWHKEQRKLLNIHADCDIDDENIFVRELEVEE